MFRQPLHNRRRREVDRHVAHDEAGHADARGGSSQRDRAIVARLDQRITVRVHIQHSTPQRVQHDFEAGRSGRGERHDREPGACKPLGEPGFERAAQDRHRTLPPAARELDGHGRPRGPGRRDRSFAGGGKGQRVAEVMGAGINGAGNYFGRSIGRHGWMAARAGGRLGLGVAAAVTRWPSLLALTQWLRPLGTLFLNLLSMVVIPLVATALFAGVAGLGDLRRVGRLGIRTLAFFWGTTLAAILIGLGVAALLLPFTHITPDQQAALRQAAAADSGAVRHAAEQITTGARFIVELIPSNPVRAAVDGNLLPLIVFVTIFGVAAAALPDEKRHTLTDLADVATHALIRIVRWVLLLAPLGIFAIVAGAVAQFGVQLVEIMAVFIVTVIVGLAVLIAAVYLPAVALVARIHPSPYLRAIRASLVMAFSTTSSLATLPVMLEAAESDLRISRTVASFVLPLGASIGRTGSALFQTVAVLFMARLYGVPLGLGGTVQAGVAVFLASLTVASVPSASIVSLVPAFTATGLPLTGLQLLLGLDRIPDMFRTMTNVFGTLSAATVVDAVEEEAP